MKFFFLEALGDILCLCSFKLSARFSSLSLLDQGSYYLATCKGEPITTHSGLKILWLDVPFLHPALKSETTGGGLLTLLLSDLLFCLSFGLV